MKANDETASMAKGSAMKKRNLSIKDSDSDFNLDAILGKAELRVTGGGKADTGSKAETGNCKAEQSDDPNKPKKKKSETTTTPRVKKTAAPSTSGVGKATVKANREMDAADQLVAMINTTLKLAEKSDSMSGGFLKDLAKL